MLSYKYTFRFNASHNTSLNEDGRHVHTFEVVCCVRQTNSSYDMVERQIKGYLLRYKGADLNQLMDGPPTIEAIASKMFNDINAIAQNFQLYRLELSDKPVQTYIIGYK